MEILIFVFIKRKKSKTLFPICRNLNVSVVIFIAIVWSMKAITKHVRLTILPATGLLHYHNKMISVHHQNLIKNNVKWYTTLIINEFCHVHESNTYLMKINFVHGVSTNFNYLLLAT